MAPRLSIGDFSRMTHLSVKALRHYHEWGLLAPASVDERTGYRFYGQEQVAAAQVIRRFRELGLPIDTVKAVLAAPDVDTRNALLARHLERMELELSRTRDAVASLRALLEGTPAAVAISYRSIPQQTVAAVAERVELPVLGAWISASFDALSAALEQHGVAAAGPRGGVYPTALFTDEVADVVVFIPVVQPLPATGEIRTITLPEVEVAVALHRGPLREADRTYAPLGTYVTERALGIDGPIREYYLTTADEVADEQELLSEICWPIFRSQ
jgi:DNA-binding transcriptional MerR regulator